MSGVYDFSQLFRASVVSFSPGTTFLATAHLNRIIVRSTANLAVVRTWVCQPSSPAAGPNGSSLTSSSSARRANESNDSFAINSLQWSEDGMYLLAFSAKTSCAWVFGLVEEGIGACGEMALLAGEGLDGLVHAEWARGGREILAWSDHNLRVTIYSSKDSTARVIQNPKNHEHCHCYSADNRYLAIIERHAGKDHAGIYDMQDNVKLVRHFPLHTSDAQGLSWSPDGKWLAVWDSPLSYSLYVYSPIGSVLLHLHPGSTAFALGSSSTRSEPEDPGMGVRSVRWAPGGRFLVVGDWAGKVRVIEVEGWRCIAEMGWGPKITDHQVCVWKESHDWLAETRGRGIVQFDRSYGPSSVPTLRQDFAASPPRSGVSQLSFSPSGSHLLVQLDIQPNVLHVHSFMPETHRGAAPAIRHVAAIVFVHPVRAARWAPKGARLAVVTRGGKSATTESHVGGAVYFWDAEGWIEEGVEERGGGMAEGVGVPVRVDFAPSEAVFSPDGSTLALLDKQQFCLLYEVEDDLLAPADGLEEGLSGIVEEDEEPSFAHLRQPLAGLAR